MDSETKEAIFDEIKGINIPKKGIMVFKSDNIDEETINMIKNQLEEKFDFQGAVMCLSTEDDIYFLGESQTAEVFKELITKVKDLESTVESLLIERSIENNE